MIDLSTHVLDVERGLPASGVRVLLFSASEQIADATTNRDGRIPQLAEELRPGVYRLEFDVAAYLSAQGRSAPFLQRVTLDVSLVEDRHYHVPLLLSAYACTTYRGS